MQVPYSLPTDPAGQALIEFNSAIGSLKHVILLETKPHVFVKKKDHDPEHHKQLMRERHDPYWGLEPGTLEFLNIVGTDANPHHRREVMRSLQQLVIAYDNLTDEDRIDVTTPRIAHHEDKDEDEEADHTLPVKYELIPNLASLLELGKTCCEEHHEHTKSKTKGKGKVRKKRADGTDAPSLETTMKVSHNHIPTEYYGFQHDIFRSRLRRQPRSSQSPYPYEVTPRVHVSSTLPSPPARHP